MKNNYYDKYDDLIKVLRYCYKAKHLTRTQFNLLVDMINQNKLEENLDNALEKETSESLTEWINQKRLTQKLREHLDTITSEQFEEEINEKDKKLECITDVIYSSVNKK